MLNIIVLCITVLNVLLFNATSESFICLLGIRQGGMYFIIFIYKVCY